MKKKKQRKEGISPLVNSIIHETSSVDTDPNGTYTGRADNPYEKPEQDADDL